MVIWWNSFSWLGVKDSSSLFITEFDCISMTWNFWLRAYSQRRRNLPRNQLRSHSTGNLQHIISATEDLLKKITCWKCLSPLSMRSATAGLFAPWQPVRISVVILEVWNVFDYTVNCHIMFFGILLLKYFAFLKSSKLICIGFEL